MLQQSFCALLRRKRYEAITIEDICGAANVGRSTFYSHYRSKDDLKRSSLEENLSAALTERRDAALSPEAVRGPHLQFSLAVLEHARNHLDHYRTLVGGRGGTVALAKVRQMVTSRVRDELALVCTDDDRAALPDEVAVQYVVGAFMAMLTWWLGTGAKLPPQRIDSRFRHLTMQGILK